MKSAYMLRRLMIIFMALTLSITSVACGSGNEDRSSQVQNKQTNTSIQSPTVSNNTNQKPIADGKYPVQQATYNDANGEYTLMLLNTPAGTPPMYRSTNLQMARLTDEEVKASEKTYFKSEKGQVSLHMPEDFKIEYVHNVTQSQTNPQTGQKETVVVKQESSFWKPFAGAVAGQVAGQVISNMFFRPQYYVPPVYSNGGMQGYGGYGNNYGQAVQSYQTRYNSPPPAVTNRTTLRTTGRLNNNSNFNRTNSNTNRSIERNRATGSGFGSSTLRQSDRSRPTVRPSGGSSRSFGSGRSRSSSGFGSRRR
ncbi:hypothetical protein [Chamaesiphon sp. VAR_48_metabat_135_sub]|uniref:hypothetical protein n=1 Tax=Chamaesiphon sp. VAR_48_metabat_135_sub TaxID=2964699 RepID=UPI00286A5CD9|nr:hypothetical protein [Chamaesiphon sp. VAR_48_metabat_135_sub]